MGRRLVQDHHARRFLIVIARKLPPLQDGNPQAGKIAFGHVGAPHLHSFVRLGRVALLPCVRGLTREAEGHPIGQCHYAHSAQRRQAIQYLVLDYIDLLVGVARDVTPTDAVST